MLYWTFFCYLNFLRRYCNVHSEMAEKFKRSRATRNITPHVLGFFLSVTYLQWKRCTTATRWYWMAFYVQPVQVETRCLKGLRTRSALKLHPSSFTPELLLVEIHLYEPNLDYFWHLWLNYSIGRCWIQFRTNVGFGTCYMSQMWPKFWSSSCDSGRGKCYQA